MLDLKEYEKLESISIVITQPLINSYSEASGDHNLIHLNTEFAENTSFGHIIDHGMLTLSLIDQMMTKTFKNHWSQTGVLKSKFRGAASVNDHVGSIGLLKSHEEMDDILRLTYDVSVVNMNSKDLLIGGTCTVEVPKLLKPKA